MVRCQKEKHVAGRRRFLQALMGGGAWILAALRPTRSAAGNVEKKRAQATLKRIVEQYARSQSDPWTMVHGVRAIGKEFSLEGGIKAVDHILSTVVRIKEIGGKPYLYVPIEVEAHANSFLETFLTVGVEWERPVKAEGRVYTFRDLFESAKQLFRFDPSQEGADHHAKDDFAWTLIALPFRS